MPSAPSNPEPTNLQAPHSFGFFTVLNGVTSPGGTAPGLSYDNLYYPGGSPQTSSDYPFHGGVLDIYGLVFQTASGKSVNLWSNGDSGGGVDYGVAVTDGTSVLDYVAGGVAVVPEPAEWPVMAGGVALAGAFLGRRRARASVAA